MLNEVYCMVHSYQLGNCPPDQPTKSKGKRLNTIFYAKLAAILPRISIYFQDFFDLKLVELCGYVYSGILLLRKDNRNYITSFNLILRKS